MRYIKSFNQKKELLSHRKVGWRITIYFKKPPDISIVLRNVTQININKYLLKFHSHIFNNFTQFASKTIKKVGITVENKKEKEFWDSRYNEIKQNRVGDFSPPSIQKYLSSKLSKHYTSFTPTPKFYKSSKKTKTIKRRE